MRRREETASERERDRRGTPVEHRNTRESTAGVETPAAERPPPGPVRGMHAEAGAHRVRMQ